MKPIIRHRQFTKNFKSRISPYPKLKQKFVKCLDLFIEGERHSLNDHRLIGTMKGLRSFSVTGDIRVVYRETDDCVEFLDIGTHNQVY